MKAFFLAALVFCCGCKKEEAAKTLKLVVAASVGPAAHAIAARARETEGVHIRVHAGASSLVARQIAKGAPCDVVILADDDWMRFLSEHQKVADARPFVGNQLVWVAKDEASLKYANRIAMGDPAHVPAGKYAKKALEARGEWERVKDRIVAAPDVRSALLWVEKGEADAGVVYESDARSSSKVRIVGFLDSVEPIRFPIARCRGSGGADALLRLMRAPFAQQILKDYGFEIVSARS